MEVGDVSDLREGDAVLSFIHIGELDEVRKYQNGMERVGSPRSWSGCRLVRVDDTGAIC